MPTSEHPPLVNMEALGKWHYRNRLGNCAADRETWPCQGWRDAETMNALHAALLTAQRENERLIAQHNALDGEFQKTVARLRAVERERDEWGGKAATYQHEASAFRRQRDELAQSIAQLTGEFP